MSVDPCAVRASVGQFINLRPIKPAQWGSALNKAGRLVLRGKCKGQTIKLYEAASVEHAQFIETVCRHKLLADCFPRVQAMHGRFLMVDWVKNQTRRRPTPDVLVELLRRLHGMPTTDLPRTGFDYWNDFIKPRFARVAQLFGIESLAQQIMVQVGTAWEGSCKFLMHPDLTPANVVLDAQGHWQVVDNELLTVGGLPLLDVCNAVYALGPQEGQTYVELYLARTAVRVTQHDLDILGAAWLARILGSNFVSGELSTAQRTLDRYRNAQNILPAQISPTDT